METLVIVNPSAGSGVDVQRLRDLLSLEDCVIEVTSAPGESRALATRAVQTGASLVVVAGGDGTIHEVVNGLAPHFNRIRLGIIPTGTGNDAARSLGIPDDIGEAAQRIREGSSRLIDLIEIRKPGEISYAINAITGGFGGAVNEAMSGEVKDFWGSLAYVRAAAEVIPGPPAYDVHISIDGGVVQNLRVISFVVANGEFAANGVPVAPNAMVDDGRLSVHAVLESTPGELLALATQILGGDIPDHDNYLHWDCREVSFSAEGEFPISVDGERATVMDISYRVLPECLEIVGVADKVNHQ